MAQKRNGPAGNGAEGIAVFTENTASIAKLVAANSPVIASIKRRPYGKAAWLVSIKGICTDMPVRDHKLRRYRRFGAAIKYRFGVTFEPMQQADWSGIVEAVIGGASS